TDPTARRWGFELTAIDAGGASTLVGNLTITDMVNTWKRVASDSGKSRAYISHTEDGTFLGKTGSNSWSFNWTAPAASVGDVTFYAAGNAADGQVTPEGDYIYATSAVAKAAVANHPPSFDATPSRVIGVGDRISFTVSATD